MHCLDCGYDLRNLSEHKCPECGRGFDLSDTRTWGTRKGYLYRRSARLAGVVCATLAALPAVISTGYIVSGQEDRIIIVFCWMFAMIPVGIVATVWIACLAACGRTPTIRAAVIGFLLLVLNASMFTQWPIDLAFRLHRPAFNRQVQKAQAGQIPAGPTKIGIYRIHAIGITYSAQGAQSVVFDLDPNTGGPDHFVYGMTSSEIESSFNIWSYRRLDKDWHIVHED